MLYPIELGVRETDILRESHRHASRQRHLRLRGRTLFSSPRLSYGEHLLAPPIIGGRAKSAGCPLDFGLASFVFIPLQNAIENRNMSQPLAEHDERRHDVSMIEAPPTTVFGILRRLGPGLIIAGSIVGSGELIATTATGAQAGFWLLWLIIIGCVIKVFVQVELGRYTIIYGRTTMKGMDEVPGPMIEMNAGGRPGSSSLRGNWFLWYWLSVFVVSLGQLGGIVGGVGQAMAISMPLTAGGRTYNEQLDAKTTRIVKLHELQRSRAQGKATDDATGKIEQLKREIAEFDLRIKGVAGGLFDGWDTNKDELVSLDEILQQDQRLWALLLYRADMDQDGKLSHEEFKATPKTLAPAIGSQPFDVRDLDDDGFLSEDEFFQQNERLFAWLRDNADHDHDDRLSLSEFGKRPPALEANAYDDRLWAAIITVITAVVLVLGRYGLIQSFSTFMVASFTVITIVNLIALQTNATYAITWQEIANGLSFRLTPKSEVLGVSPLATALMTFGIIGVGGNELVSYPYWCLEKGYARFTGPREDSPEWFARANGWMRVMRWDCWCSMVVYTFATIAFYLLGAAILGRIKLSPEGNEMIRTLAVMYEPVFGTWTQFLFLFGAFAVLYSTFFVANASHARVFPDTLRVFGIAAKDDASYRNRVRFFSGLFPFLCLIIYILIPKPTTLVLASGAMQAIMLPMLSGGALYFRYFRTDKRMAPGRVWDILLWLSAIGMLIAGGWLTLVILFPALKQFG
jgi:Mn2+/Fe2+ NRAMP family transporter